MNKLKGPVRIFYLVLSVLLFAACGSEGYVPEEPPVEPLPEDGGELPEVVPGEGFGLVMSRELPADQNAQMLQTFTQVQPALLDSLNVAAIEQDRTQGFGYGDLALNWDSSQMVYKKDANQNLLVDVVAAPVQSPNLEPEKLQMMAAAGELPDVLTVGAVAVLSDYPDLSSGKYLLEWYSETNAMSICNPETGECSAPEFCEDSNPVPFPVVEINGGSVTVCVRFDSRSCCVTFGK